MKKHKKYCKFYRALSCLVSIECNHGYDVCPQCDPCTCTAEDRLKILLK